MTVPVRRLPDDATTAVTALDLALGAVVVTAHVAEATVRTLRLTPVVRVATRPLLRAGGGVRRRIVREVDAWLPLLVDRAVRRYVDLDALVETVDLDAVAARLDVEAVVARVDLDEVATRLDVEAVLDRLDLTETVLSRVDLKRVVDTVLAQVDLPALVEDVLDQIDLPEIIRDSTGTMASETVRSVRMQGVSADQAVARAVDRLRLRRRPAPGGAV